MSKRKSLVLSAGTVIEHVHLQRSNLEDAMSFYERILGFDRVALYGSSAAFYAAGGYQHPGGLKPWASANGQKAKPEMMGPDQFEIIYRATVQVLHLIDALSASNTCFNREEQGISINDPTGIPRFTRVQS